MMCCEMYKWEILQVLKFKCLWCPGREEERDRVGEGER